MKTREETFSELQKQVDKISGFFGCDPNKITAICTIASIEILLDIRELLEKLTNQTK